MAIGDDDNKAVHHVQFRENSFSVLLAPLKGSRSMTVCPPQEALARLWLEPPIYTAERFRPQLWAGWSGRSACHLEVSTDPLI